MSVLRKYCKRTSFDQLDFEAFVAGETHTILQTQDYRTAVGRLGFLSKIAHWQCRSRDWGLIKGLYEAVLESIELGEESWGSDFSHYETMVPGQVRMETKERERMEQKSKKTELYWCKGYQKGTCKERSPHMLQIKPDEQPVPVVHYCAFCMQKDNCRSEHAEYECPKKGNSG